MDRLLSIFRGKSTHLQTAEAFIREQDPLYRHYSISEVISHVKQFLHIELTDNEAVSIVQKIRDEYGMGPISDYNMPGYVEEE